MLTRISWIDKANELVEISDVLALAGVDVPSSIQDGSTKKIHCPFGFYHSDRGVSKAMRLYSTNNAVYCFSCAKRYSPVSLASAMWDCSWENAAFRLLDLIGYKPKSLEERWQEAIASKEEEPDILLLAEALKTYCSGIASDWNTRRLDEHISHVLSKCLALLQQVKTKEDAGEWLTTCKMIMKKLLETP